MRPSGIRGFSIGRRLAKEHRAIRILGILDLLATVYVVGLYILAIVLLGR